MICNLRERRRRQTARDIQQAALLLALRGGYDAVTADAIAAEAGISPRTFFNYYPNKQAAMLGVPPCLEPERLGWFAQSRQPLMADLVLVMATMIEEDRLDRKLMRSIRQLIEAEPQLQPLFRGKLDRVAEDLTGLLSQRLGPESEQKAHLIAMLCCEAMAQAVWDWIDDETMDQSRIAEALRQRLIAVCAALGGG